MTRMNSRPVTQTVVYAQDVQPTDTRDGIMWVDTASAENDLYTYDAGNSEWVLAAPSNIAIQDTAPSAASLGDGWIDTSLTVPVLKIYDGSSWQKDSVTDHGNMTGLGDDDHPQYVKDSLNPQSVAGSRSPGTWYQNTTGNPLLVYLVVNSTGSGTATYQVHVNDSQTDRQVTGNTRSSSNSPVGSLVWVPDGLYYKVIGNTNFNLQDWLEAELR